MNESVECHSGHTYADYPLAFQWESERLEVSEIEREWRSPAGKHFRVRISDGREFELVFSEIDDGWRIQVV